MVWGSGGVGWGGFVLGIEVSYQVVVSDIQVFCSTSCQKLMMDFKLYICYAADGFKLYILRIKPLPVPKLIAPPNTNSILVLKYEVPLTVLSKVPNWLSY